MDEISDFFMRKLTKKVVLKATRDETKRIQGCVQKSSSGVPWEIGGGKYGHLDVTVLGKDCVSETTEEFVEQKNLNKSPFVPENNTQHQTTGSKEKHNTS